MHIEKIKRLNEKQCVQIRNLLQLAKWNLGQIEGQLEALSRLLDDVNGVVLFALEQNRIIGYILAQFYSWNRLGQIHGLMIHPECRNRGTASTLVKEVEIFMQAHQARGLYVDTPVNNVEGWSFYQKKEFQKAYVMPEYYDVGVDGITFLKIFR
jgi:ribosomal protein S18 acetylase RimI-like enzyme